MGTLIFRIHKNNLSFSDDEDEDDDEDDDDNDIGINLQSTSSSRHEAAKAAQVVMTAAAVMMASKQAKGKNTAKRPGLGSSSSKACRSSLNGINICVTMLYKTLILMAIYKPLSLE